MIDYRDKKWTWITPLNTTWNPPDPNEGYTIDAERNFTRLIRANAFHIDCENIDMTSDIYVLVQFDINNIEKEIEFVKKIKSLDKKFVLCYSADLRFLLGNCFVSKKGTLYTELCKYADVILSGTSTDIDIYGRYYNKVLHWGLPVERLDFSDRSYNERQIDILISSSAGEESFSFEFELEMLLLEKHPDLKIVHSLQECHKSWLDPFRNKGVEFVHESLLKNLVNTKVYINPEIRPRGGRALLDAYYCRTPFISCDMTFYSQIFPEFTYNRMHINNIADLYDKVIQSNYNTIISKAEKIMEPLYFDNCIKDLMKRLYP